MPRVIRAYTYNLCDSFVPPDVVEALGEPSYRRWQRPLVFARTAKAALDSLIDLGLQDYGARKPHPASALDVVALETAGLNTDGSVYVIGYQTSNVGRVHFDESYIGARTTTVIGYIHYPNLGQPLEFVPVKELDNGQQSPHGADHVLP